MTLVQRVVCALMPKTWADQVRAESLEWVFCCDCGAERSVWDLGGVRFKAKGSQRVLRACDTCGRRSFQDLVRKPLAAPPTPPAS